MQLKGIKLTEVVGLHAKYRLPSNYMLNFEGMYIWSIKNITSMQNTLDFTLGGLSSNWFFNFSLQCIRDLSFSFIHYKITQGDIPILKFYVCIVSQNMVECLLSRHDTSMLYVKSQQE